MVRSLSVGMREDEYWGNCGAGVEATSSVRAPSHGSRLGGQGSTDRCTAGRSHQHLQVEISSWVPPYYNSLACSARLPRSVHHGVIMYNALVCLVKPTLLNLATSWPCTHVLSYRSVVSKLIETISIPKLYTLTQSELCRSDDFDVEGTSSWHWQWDLSSFGSYWCCWGWGPLSSRSYFCFDLSPTGRRRRCSPVRHDVFLPVSRGVCSVKTAVFYSILGLFRGGIPCTTDSMLATGH